MSKKRYKVRVIEHYVDEVWVEAESQKEAEDKALDEAETQYECLWDTEVVDWEELEDE
jgi:hypothetical protein